MNDCFNILQKLPESVFSILPGKFGRISLLLFLVCFAQQEGRRSGVMWRLWPVGTSSSGCAGGRSPLPLLGQSPPDNAP